MLQLLIHNYVLHTHTRTDTHIRTYVHAWVHNSSMHSVHQGGPAHRGPCTEGTPVPRRLVDEDGLRGLPLVQRTGQGKSGVAFLVWELVRLQEPLHRRRREDGLCLAACKFVTGLFVTLFSKSQSRCGKEDAGSRLRRAFEAVPVRGSLQNIPNFRPPFCP